MTQPLFERAEAPFSVSDVLAEIRASDTFGKLIAAMTRLAELTGQDETVDELKGQVQYGLRQRGQKARKQINTRVRAILGRVQNDPLQLTAEDRDVLSQYSGRGGIADDNSLSEYYTPTPIAEGVWDALKANGFENGNVLEPSTGAGVFLATKPAGTVITGAEIDPTSSGVSALLHPTDLIANQSFEQLCAQAKDDTFDSVIGNVPFGDARGKWAKFDTQYQSIKEMERYFVTRAIDKVRPGGLIALIVPPNIISKRSKTFISWRREISHKAEFLGAHKLPSGTFGGANGNGTDTVVDVLIMRKHSRELLDRIPDLSTETLAGALVLWDQFIAGRWFEQDGKRFVHGEIVEGFRTEVKSEIDNQGLKRLMARKFDSRIDFGALETAPTITRNYEDGDRRVIGMQMHEMVNGQWLKVSAGLGLDEQTGALDAERYGAASVKELEGILGGSPSSALQVRFEQARNAMEGPLADSLTPTVKKAVTAALGVDEKMRERVYRAVLIGAEINRYSRELTETGEINEYLLERLQHMVTAESEQFGNPARERGFRKVRGQGGTEVAAFTNAMRKTGGFSDLLSGKRTGERGQSYDDKDPADITRYLSIQHGNGPIPIEYINAMYSGSDTLTLEALARHDSVAITTDGFVQPMDYYAAGNVVKQLAKLSEAMASEQSQALLDKYARQVDEINSRRHFTDVDNITFNMRAKWIDRKLVVDFLDERGYTHVGYSRNTGEFQAHFGTKPEKFDKQLINYLNGQTVRSSDASASAEYKRQLSDLEEQFNVWLRQHDDIDSLVAQYNDTFNGWVPVEYNTSDLSLENVADWIKPHDYQAAGVRRLSDEGRGILAFDVGLGKTLSALSLVQYNIQKGRARRSVIVVPKAVLENWYHESRQFHKSMDHVHFIGFTPVMEGGKVQRTPVLDDEGVPRRNRHTGEIQYRDVLKEDSADVIFDKMNEIPQTSKNLIVMSRERFGMIPLRPDTREAYADRMVDRNLLNDSMAASLAENGDIKLGRDGTYKLRKKTEQYQQKYNDDGTRKQGDYPFYEDMGFDSVIVDEGHDYKNTYQATGETQRLAYLPTPQPSKRSLDMAVKMDHLRQKNGGTGPVLLTATPVTNSPTEIYNMLSHVLAPEEFERMGIVNVDDFVREFCEIEMVERVKLSGAVVEEEGVSGFKNLDGLRSLFHRYTNMKSAADVNDDDNKLKIPDANEINDAVDMTPVQRQIYEELRAEADRINQGEELTLNADGTMSLEEARPVFAIIRDMDRVTTDLDLYLKTMTFTFPVKYAGQVDKLVADLPKSLKRLLRDEETGETENVPMELADSLKLDKGDATIVLIVPELYESEVVKRLKKHGIAEKDVAHPVMPKYAKLLANLHKEFDNGGKQIIFTEEKSQHDKLKRIIVHHLPIEAGQVGIINADTASGDKLERISAAYNNGDVRIVIANKKAEVGVNLQKGTTAIHHLTLPWTPASIQQRNGRGVRQGNTAASVDVYYYLGKGSFDEYRLNLLKRKGEWINDLFFGDDARAENANAGMDEEYAAMLAADPEQQRRRIAEMRERKAREAREKANQKATINLANLRNFKDFINNYDDNLNVAVSTAMRNDRDVEATRARMEAKRTKALTQIKQLEGVLANDQEKGRIDIDAKRLIHSGNYVTTLQGAIIEIGQTYRGRHRYDERVYEVDRINVQEGMVHLTALGSGNGASYAINKLLDSMEQVQLTKGDRDQALLLGGRIDYASLGQMDVDNAWLAEKTRSILNATPGRVLVIVATPDGELDAGYSSTMAYNKGVLVKPELDNAEWRERAARVLFQRATERHGSEAFRAFGAQLLGSDWLSEAADKYGNYPTTQVMSEVAIEAMTEKLAGYKSSIDDKADMLAEKKVTEQVARDEIGRHLGYARGTASAMKAAVSDAAIRSLREAGYDVWNDKVAAIVTPLVDERMVPDFIEHGNLVLKGLLLELQIHAEKEAAKKAELAAKALDGLPQEVREFFDGLGIRIKLNPETLQWQSKGGGKRASRAPVKTSQPGELVMLFDPAGRSGKLAEVAAGRASPLQSSYNATWTIFDGDLWWHMPANGVDYDDLMEVFA